MLMQTMAATDVLSEFEKAPGELRWLVRALILVGQTARSGDDVVESLSTIQAMLASVDSDQRLLMALEAIKNENGQRAESEDSSEIVELRRLLADPTASLAEREALTRRAASLLLGEESQPGLEALRGLADPACSEEMRAKHRATIMRLLSDR